MARATIYMLVFSLFFFFCLRFSTASSSNKKPPLWHPPPHDADEPTTDLNLFARLPYCPFTSSFLHRFCFASRLHLLLPHILPPSRGRSRRSSSPTPCPCFWSEMMVHVDD
ncbi:unnamed protein product [Lactuca virosa]|uniref:Uncharacterized protein n=1 Tax=Lactuca virosa TaxID=75947 RepID=A0AAU9LDW7_9ASTR|nr:unnamed protein product [Lactuca virosa]